MLQEFGEAVIGNLAGLGKAIHAFANFQVDVSIVDHVVEVV